MSYYDYYLLEDIADELAKKIIKRYKSHGVSIGIKDKGITILQDRFKFKIKLLPGTRVDQIDKYSKDVQVSLKLPLFQVIQESLSIFIIASKESLKDNNLLDIFKSSEYIAAKKIMEIAHPLGFDATNKLVIADLALYPHLMLCGTTGSGKSMALKSLLVSLLGGYSPNKVNILICDKAGDLLPFSELPHLLCPIIQDFEVFFNIILLLQAEMERRINMKHSEEFSRLPVIVCVIDEFLSFISGTDDKRSSKLARDVISDILRRGRHAHIHMILAAHNPTKENVKIDISDIPSKMAFRVAKFTNSVTVLGQSGAEKLLGKGDMLFQSSQNDEFQRVQGAYISPEEMEEALNQIRTYYSKVPKQKEDAHSPHNGFMLTGTDLQQMGIKTGDERIKIPMTNTTRNRDDALLARIIMWTLEHDLVSCNKIIETFNIGWRRANGFLERLCEFGIVGDIYKKLPREVLPISVEDISAETMDFLSKSGVAVNDITTAIQNRNSAQ